MISISSMMTKCRLVLFCVIAISSSSVIFAAELQQSEQLKSAIAMRKAGDHRQAIDILGQLREKYIEHKRINIELALNYIKMQHYENAEQILQHLQALSLTDREYKTLEKLKRILERKMRKSLSPHAFTVDLGVGLGIDIVSNQFPVFVYDDFQNNDDYWLEDEEIDELGFDYEYDVIDYSDVNDYWNREDITEESEVSYSREFLSVNYRYRPSHQFELFSHATQWILDNDLSIDYRHLNQSDNNNFLNYEFNSSLYLLQINRWFLELNGLVSAHDNDGKRVLNKYRGRLSISIPFHTSKVKFAIDQQRKSYRSQLSNYDANIVMPWGEYSYRFSSQFRFIAGVKYKRHSARDSFNSYNNRDFYLGIYYYPTSSLSAYMTYHDNKLHYKIDDPELVNWSNEKKQSVAFGLKYQASEAISINLNGNFGSKTIELGFGQDDWQRIETSIVYRF